MKLTTTQKMLEQLKKPGKNKKTKLNHQQNHRIPLRNSFEILPIEEYQDKQLLMRTTPCYLHFMMHLVNEDKKAVKIQQTTRGLHN